MHQLRSWVKGPKCQMTVNNARSRKTTKYNPYEAENCIICVSKSLFQIKNNARRANVAINAGLYFGRRYRLICLYVFITVTPKLFGHLKRFGHKNNNFSERIRHWKRAARQSFRRQRKSNFKSRKTRIRGFMRTTEIDRTFIGGSKYFSLSKNNYSHCWNWALYFFLHKN